jgi:hypothetical protein
MSSFPLNEFKLSKRGKEVLNDCREILKHNVTKVHVSAEDFNELLEGISASIRYNYINTIPFGEKFIVRK